MKDPINHQTKPFIIASEHNFPVGARILDAYDGMIRELYYYFNPKQKINRIPVDQKQLDGFIKEYSAYGVWVCMPWANTVVKILKEKYYYLLRTSRNRNIITTKEQQKYREATVGILGLSVGSSIFHALILSGGPKKIKIADPDVVETTNLNRMRATLAHLGQNKAVIAAQQAWELDPYADIEVFPEGVTNDNLPKFIMEPKLDICIDQVDDLRSKIQIRLNCKKNRIPVIMATDMGDGIILDVERFDTEPDREIFHGNINHYNLKELNTPKFNDWLKLAVDIIGENYIDEKVKHSLPEIGNTISGIPQLGTTAMIAGAAAGFAVRKILNNQNLPSGKYKFDLEKQITV